MATEEFREDAAHCLAEFGGFVLTERSFDRVLELIIEVTQRAVRSAQLVSVTLMRDGSTPYTSHASDPLAVRLDEVQYEESRGPCLKALKTHESVNAVMTESHNEWPKFAQEALAAGMGSVLSSPLSVPDRLLGALNIYAGGAKLFTDDDQKTAGLLAQQAAVLLANAVAFEGASALNHQLQDALETRDLIGQAKGILMEREGCASDHAFDILRRASQRSNRKLRDVAAELVESAQARDRGLR